MKAVFLVLMAFALAAAPPAAGQDLEVPDIPELRVDIGPEAALSTNSYVDGQLVLRVQLVSRHRFEALSLDLPSIANAEVVELMRPRTREVSSYAGRGWVFETSIAILPRTSGLMTIPPVTATGRIEPEEGREVAFDLASEPVTVKIAGVSPHFNARGDSPWWLVSERVEIDEAWSVPVDELRVGEIVERRITLRVWGVTEARLPKLEHPRTRGIRVSQLSATAATGKSPEGLIATAEYVWLLEPEPRQVAFIAPVGLAYWHPLEHRRMKAAVPGHRIEPLPADSAAIATRLMAEATARRQGQRLAGMAVAGVVLAPAGLFLLALGLTMLPSRADLRLRAACRSGASPGTIYKAYRAWARAHGKAVRDIDPVGQAGRALSLQLFSPAHPRMRTPKDLAAAALAHARASRRAALFAWLRSFLGIGGSGSRAPASSHR